ncbi:MAG TPA: hypothetical protein VKT12_04895 [Candidatus Binataceae bacterium]|nr:hypothetical protein [Candidatus Binataceae bacterium]
MKNMLKLGFSRRPCLPLAVIAITILASMCFVSTQAYSAPPANGPNHGVHTHFVPNSQAFWDFSKNWTTNYGPAYRDTDLAPTNFVPCIGQYALCFESGPEPLPCKLSPDGRFANCKCVVKTGLNFVLITSILNEKVYQETVAQCGSDGAGCTVDTVDTNPAPVCKAMQDGNLIPGAEVISDWSPDVQRLLTEGGTPPLTVCDKAPYAGCMTAPCRQTKDGYAECSCPIFWGIFQIFGEGAQCTLSDDLVNSASYDPVRDVLPTPTPTPTP